MDTTTLLHQLLARRILVLDGAMGTMIQRLKLTDEQFRGERFRAHPTDLKGNSDLLVLTRRRHHRNEYLHGDNHLAGRLQARIHRL
jgi:methionine synthase I (cobalamin-dependent)